MGVATAVETELGIGTGAMTGDGVEGIVGTLTAGNGEAEAVEGIGAPAEATFCGPAVSGRTQDAPVPNSVWLTDPCASTCNTQLATWPQLVGLLVRQAWSASGKSDDDETPPATSDAVPFTTRNGFVIVFPLGEIQLTRTDFVAAASNTRMDDFAKLASTTHGASGSAQDVTAEATDRSIVSIQSIEVRVPTKRCATFWRTFVESVDHWFDPSPLR